MRLSSIVKGAGAGATVLARQPWTRAAAAGTSYRVGKEIDPLGLEVVSISVHEDEPSSSWERALAEVVGVGSWTVASLVVAAVLDRLPLPRPVTALGYAGAVAFADDVLSRKLLGVRAEAEARAADSGATGPASNG